MKSKQKCINQKIMLPQTKLQIQIKRDPSLTLTKRVKGQQIQLRITKSPLPPHKNYSNVMYINIKKSNNIKNSMKPFKQKQSFKKNQKLSKMDLQKSSKNNLFLNFQPDTNTGLRQTNLGQNLTKQQHIKIMKNQEQKKSLSKTKSGKKQIDQNIKKTILQSKTCQKQKQSLSKTKSGKSKSNQNKKTILTSEKRQNPLSIASHSNKKLLTSTQYSKKDFQKSPLKNKETSKKKQKEQISKNSMQTQEAELKKLKEQNQKYKEFLISSAIKLEDLKKDIEQSKQIRQTEKGYYNFQLSNLKRQLQANKKNIGHLYSYDDPMIENFLPDQIIIETDNESSSVRESLSMFVKGSKLQKNPSDQLVAKTTNKIKFSEKQQPLAMKQHQVNPLKLQTKNSALQIDINILSLNGSQKQEVI